MSRNYRSGEFVSHGSAAGLDNLAAVSGGFTAWLVLYRAANGNNQHFLTKDAAGPQGWNGRITTINGEGTLTVTIQLATTDAVIESSTGIIALNTPYFVAFTYDSAASPSIKGFLGAVGGAVAEITYGTQTSGSGAPVDDAAANLYVGNLERANTNPWLGSIQMGGIVSGDTLSAAELDSIWQLAQDAVTDDPDLSDIETLFAHALLFNYQAGDLTDRSANSNDGSATGTQSGPDFPIRAHAGEADYLMGVM